MALSLSTIVSKFCCYFYEERDKRCMALWSWVSNWPYLELTKNPTVGHTCEEIFLIAPFEEGRPTLNVYKGCGKKFFACLPSISLASSSILQPRHSFSLLLQDSDTYTEHQQTSSPIGWTIIKGILELWLGNSHCWTSRTTAWKPL